MNLRLAIEGLSTQNAAHRLASGAPSSFLQDTSPRGQSAFSEHLKRSLADSRRQNQLRPALASPKLSEPAPQRTALTISIRRAISWLRGTASQEKKLRVIETVPLGEKRIVAIVEAEGNRFLVGCGSEGVSLLTQLTAQQKPDMSLDPSLGLAGATE